MAKEKGKQSNSTQNAYLEYQKRENAVMQARMEQIESERSAINICLQEYGNKDKQQDFLEKLRKTYYSETKIQEFEEVFGIWNQDSVDINTVKNIADALQHISQNTEKESFVQKAGKFVNKIFDQGKE